MKKINLKIKLKNIPVFFKKLPFYLASHKGILFLVFLFISLILVSFIFYKFYYVPINGNLKVSENLLPFNESSYNRLLQEWRERDERFNGVGVKDFDNPFSLKR